ncbi:uncharacterized protein [Amphiura filiformis]|uniref:uncharacterized protein n=1 Tax=Amphiura filiformis TaxID=82378 RepID=UPI003B221BF4
MVKEDYSKLTTFQFNGSAAAAEQSNGDYVDEDVLKEKKRREESIKRQELIAKRKRKAAAQGRTKPRRSSYPADQNGKPPPVRRGRRNSVAPRPSLPTIKETPSTNNLQDRTNNAESNSNPKVQESDNKTDSQQISNISEKRKPIPTQKSNKITLGRRRRPPPKPIPTNSDDATTSKSDAEASKPEASTSEATTADSKPETEEPTERPQTVTSVKPTSPKSRPQTVQSQKSIKAKTPDPERSETALSKTSKTSKARPETSSAKSSKSTKSNKSKESKRPDSSESKRPETSVSNRPDTVQSQNANEKEETKPPSPDDEEKSQIQQPKKEETQPQPAPKLSISTFARLKGMFGRKKAGKKKTENENIKQTTEVVADEEKSPNGTELDREKMVSRASSQNVKEEPEQKEEEKEEKEEEAEEEEEETTPREEKSTGLLGLFKKRKPSILSSMRSSVVSLKSIPEETPSEPDNKGKTVGGWGRLKSFLKTDSPEEEKPKTPEATIETTPKQTTREPKKPIVIINGDLKGDKAFQKTLLAALRGDAPDPDIYEEPETRTTTRQQQQPQNRQPQQPLNTQTQQPPKDDPPSQDTASDDAPPQTQGVPQVIIQPMMMMPSYPMMYPQMMSPYGMMPMQPQMMMMPGQAMMTPGMTPLASMAPTAQMMQPNLPSLVPPQSYNRRHSYAPGYATNEETSQLPTRRFSDFQVRFPPISDGIQQPQTRRHLDRTSDPLPPLPTRPTPAQLLDRTNNAESNSNPKVQESDNKTDSQQISNISEKRKPIPTQKSNKITLGRRRRPPPKPIPTNSDDATTSKSDAEASKPEASTSEATTADSKPETEEPTERPQTVTPDTVQSQNANEKEETKPPSPDDEEKSQIQQPKKEETQPQPAPKLSISTFARLKGMFGRKKAGKKKTENENIKQTTEVVADEEKSPNGTELDREKMVSRASSQNVKEEPEQKEEEKEEKEEEAEEEEEETTPREEKSTGLLGLFKKRKPSILSSMRSSVVSLKSIPEETPSEPDNKGKTVGGWGRLKLFLKTDSPEEEKPKTPEATIETTPKQTTHLKGDKAFQKTLLAALRGDAPDPDIYEEPETRTTTRQQQQPQNRQPQQPLNTQPQQPPKDDPPSQDTASDDAPPQTQGVPQVIIQPMMMMPSYPMMYPQMMSPYGMMPMQPQMMMMPGQAMMTPGMTPLASMAPTAQKMQPNLPSLVPPQSYNRRHSYAPGYATNEETSQLPTRRFSDFQVRFPPISDGIQQPQTRRQLDRTSDPLPPLPTRPTPAQLLVESQKNLFAANNILNR